MVKIKNSRGFKEFQNSERNQNSPRGLSGNFRGNLESLAIVEELLELTNEKDQRRALLYQLRRQLIEDEITFQEARQMIVELESTLEKVTSPANRVGVYLGSPKSGIAYISVSGSDYYTNVDPRLDISKLKVGTRVLVNEAYAVVGDLGYNSSGQITKIIDLLEDGRIRIGQEHGLQSTILIRSSDLAEVKLKVGDEVRIDPSFRVALEVLSSRDVKEYYLEEIPQLSWDKVGGQAEAIQAIKDAIELPILHPELFKRFNYANPKGFLLYGPPGCGKTLIGKATAYNLIQQLKEKENMKVKGHFMHIKGPEILNMWLGESERKVREIFDIAREKRKAGYLPFVFIDEAEAILGTRRAIRSHNISNTVVPMFCAEMDGIESLQDVVIILATNRPDLIDPAVLRPGRIDRKIKVKRPDKEASKEIFSIYLTPDLPIDAKTTTANEQDVKSAVVSLIDQTLKNLFSKDETDRFLEVILRSGRKDILYRGDLVSGALIASIVQRAKESAIKRSIKSSKDEGITLDDLLKALNDEYKENDIFPPTDNTEDWLKLIDYDPENVVRVAPIKLSSSSRSKRANSVI